MNWKRTTRKGKGIVKKVVVTVLLILGGLTAIGYVLNKKGQQTPQ